MKKAIRNDKGKRKQSEKQKINHVTQETRKIKGIKNLSFMLKMMVKNNPVKVIYYIFNSIVRYVFNAIFWVNMPKAMFEAIEYGKPFSKVFWIVTIYCLCYVIFHILTVIHEYYTRVTDPKFFGQIYKKIIKKSIKTPLKKFEDPNFYDDYTHALEETEESASKLLEIMTDFLGSIAAMITVVAIIIQWDPIILLFALVPLISGYFTSKMSSNLNIKQKNALIRNKREINYSTRIFYERKYAGEIRLFPIKQMFLDLNKRSRENMTEIQREFAQKSVFISIWDHLVMKAAFPILCVVYAVYHILVKGNLSIGIYMSLIVAVQNLSWQIEDLIFNLGQFITLGKSLEYLRNFLESEDEESLEEELNKIELTESFEKLELKNVSYTYYGADKPSLNNINLTIGKGEKIAIVGYNGAGKSTLIKLIMGLYQPIGTLLYNTQNIETFSRKSYRKKFATIFQDFQIYALSIASNIIMREVQNADDEEKVRFALEKAGLYDKVYALENGVHSILTREFDDNGVLLSEGEFQKLALARAFAYEDAEIVIFDEPSSALDPISEYNLYKNIMKVASEKTVVIISHRLSSARMADRIYMMENGSIIETGTHDELMIKNGKYAQMFKAQAQNYADLGILEELSL